MKTKIFATLFLSGTVLLSGALIASAAVATTTKDKKTPDLSKIIARADQEIVRRVQALATVATRIQDMKKISDTDKTAYASEIQNEQDDLSNLKAKIDTDTDVTVLRADVKSITSSYRIFALVIPQMHILAAADRIATVFDSLISIGTKLQTRISTNTTTELTKLMNDYNVKLADAKAKADLAKSGVLSLKPDNGDANGMKANASALKAARENLKTAEKDIKDARKDAEDIMKRLKEMKPAQTATTTPGQ